MPELADVPEVKGWMTLPDAARAMGISRQRIHIQVQAGQWKSLARIGAVMVVAQYEIDAKRLNTSRPLVPEPVQG